MESTLCEVTTSAIEKCYVERNACYENILQAINYAISNTSKDSVISKKNTLVERVKELENTLSRTIDRITKVDEKLIPMLEQKALDIQEELELLSKSKDNFFDKALPMVDFPAPISPTRTRFFINYLFEIISK